MRKISLILAIFCLFLTSCRGIEKNAAPVTDNIKFNVDITYYNEKYRCEGSVNGEEMTFEVKEPETLNGMKLNIKNSHTEISYKGLTYTPSGYSLTTPYVCGKIYNAIKNIGSSNNIKDGENGNYTISGKIDNSEYVFTFSPTGYPLSLKLPSDAFYAEFFDISVING